MIKPPMEEHLTDPERKHLLKIARQALSEAVQGHPVTPLDLENLPARLQQTAASFVTLTRAGMLRGCIGALEPYLPLAADVQEHAVAAGLQDYRFPPVQPGELDQIQIEISHLTLAQPLDYSGPVDLLDKLRPGIDGVILKDGFHRATYLPQVWEKLPDKTAFLSSLCQKMGAPPDLWRRKKLQVLVYQVEEFHE
ncbi:MAG: AmmeMemoRadiSam system protein A [Anaerolineales bacterium]|nr:AmmeMemoRadiSam system protein A [Anaerolineales bacterium]